MLEGNSLKGSPQKSAGRMGMGVLNTQDRYCGVIRSSRASPQGTQEGSVLWVLKTEGYCRVICFSRGRPRGEGSVRTEADHRLRALGKTNAHNSQPVRQGRSTLPAVQAGRGHSLMTPT